MDQVEPAGHAVGEKRVDVSFEHDLSRDDIVHEAQVMQLHDDVAQLVDLHRVVFLAKSI